MNIGKSFPQTPSPIARPHGWSAGAHPETWPVPYRDRAACPKLLGITKRGSKYLRKLVIQGARTALPALAKTATPLGVWLRGLLARAHGNTVVVALASKLIRIAWALLRNRTMFAAGGHAAA